MKIKRKTRTLYVDERELRKRRRERILMLLVGCLVIVVTILVSQFSARRELPISANILVYGTDQHQYHFDFAFIVSDCPECF